MTMSDLFDNMPWAGKDSQQEKGRKHERKKLRDRGALAHPASGAGRIKDDGHDEDHVYEVKFTGKKQFTLKAADLRATFQRAIRQGKLAVWLITFEDENFTAEVRLVPDTTTGVL